jgi:hypothetical protein
MLIYITDKTGKQFWRTTVSAAYSLGEKNNMDRRFAAIQARHPAYNFVDADSARIVEEYAMGEMTNQELNDMTDDELLAMLKG